MSLGIIILLWFWYFCSFHCYGDYRDLHSFPTRRSSDLAGPTEPGIARVVFGGSTGFLRSPDRGRVGRPSKYDPQLLRVRSEEHTSELQSHSDLVCRLLLEKKNQ